MVSGRSDLALGLGFESTVRVRVRVRVRGSVAGKGEVNKTEAGS